MGTIIYLLIHKGTNKVHIKRIGLGAAQYTLCGSEAYGLYGKMIFSPAWSPSKHPDWCTKCIAKMAIDLARKGTGLLRPVMDYVLNVPVKKKEKKEKVIDAINTQLTFDSEEMEIKVTAGKSTGVRGSFAIKVEKTIVLRWDRLEELRHLATAEHCACVTMIFHAE